MRLPHKELRGWGIPIVVAAATVAVLELANLIHGGLGLLVAAAIVVGGGTVLFVSERRKR